MTAISDDAAAGTRTHDVDVDGVRLRVHEAGDGDLVVLCHGFPGLGYSWRHQMRPLADHGWRAVAPDIRGYGGSSAPSDAAEYGPSDVCRDLIGLLDHYGAERAVFVGHDFGACAVYDMALRHPDRVRALIVLSVPYGGRPERRPTETFAAMADEHFVHFHYFQEPGVAESELDAAPDAFLQGVFFALSGGFRYLDIWQHESAGNGYLDVLPVPPPLPWSWLSVDEFQHYVEVFRRTGFRGGLNWYRSADTHWQQNADLAGATIDVPTWLIAGANDTVLEMAGPDFVERMRALVPDLRDVTVIPDAGHFVQMEAADGVNAALLGYLDVCRATETE